MVSSMTKDNSNAVSIFLIVFPCTFLNSYRDFRSHEGETKRASRGMLRRLLVKISRYVGAAGKADSAGTVLLTVRRAVLCLLRNYASVCLLWQLLDLLSYAPPEKRYALTAGAVTFLAVMIFLVAGLAQLCPRQGADDAVRT